MERSWIISLFFTRLNTFLESYKPNKDTHHASKVMLHIEGSE